MNDSGDLPIAIQSSPKLFWHEFAVIIKLNGQEITCEQRGSFAFVRTESPLTPIWKYSSSWIIAPFSRSHFRKGATAGGSSTTPAIAVGFKKQSSRSKNPISDSGSLGGNYVNESQLRRTQDRHSNCIYKFFTWITLTSQNPVSMSHCKSPVTLHRSAQQRAWPAAAHS